eukprot:CAMPEP_0179017984 /NCGR_PEP_ID=MMETSP0796-20121207/4120_1 /TAXON_ID=73915 /ORGANISM="Pyrodinium bahamense, Strain pbaha01" /LENGTH=217 /DNA_ID=CAMNT_0020713729 /DNA_START=186 /DNA_END=835 /DNA_ORIENTATION=-
MVRWTKRCSAEVPQEAIIVPPAVLPAELLQSADLAISRILAPLRVPVARVAHTCALSWLAEDAPIDSGVLPPEIWEEPLLQLRESHGNTILWVHTLLGIVRPAAVQPVGTELPRWVLMPKALQEGSVREGPAALFRHEPSLAVVDLPAGGRALRSPRGLQLGAKPRAFRDWHWPPVAHRAHGVPPISLEVLLGILASEDFLEAAQGVSLPILGLDPL